MNLRSSNEIVTNEEGSTHLSFDLADTEAGYILISLPEGQGDDEFFGADHYIEVKDQLFGRYGGIKRLVVLNDKRFELTLSIDVPNVSREISIVTTKPMSSEMLHHLRHLERP